MTAATKTPTKTPATTPAKVKKGAPAKDAAPGVERATAQRRATPAKKAPVPTPAPAAHSEQLPDAPPAPKKPGKPRPAKPEPKQDHEVPSDKEVANDAANLAAFAERPNADVPTATKTPKAAKPVKATKVTPPAKPRRLSALDAAAIVLAKSAKPMRATDMIDAMASQGLWASPGGKTPEATLYAAIIREIAVKKHESRFKKHDRGLFVATHEGA
jgi:FtsZ-interacting cell division protein ZipA